MQKTIVTV